MMATFVGLSNSCSVQEDAVNQQQEIKFPTAEKSYLKQVQRLVNMTMLHA